LRRNWRSRIRSSVAAVRSARRDAGPHDRGVWLHHPLAAVADSSVCTRSNDWWTQIASVVCSLWNADTRRLAVDDTDSSGALGGLVVFERQTAEKRTVDVRIETAGGATALVAL
jgi:hypothetical protein